MMRCPICGGETKKPYRPFCSVRCANRDLGHWLNGNYTFASSRLEDAEEAADAIEQVQQKPH